MYITKDNVYKHNTYKRHMIKAKIDCQKKIVLIIGKIFVEVVDKRISKLFIYKQYNSDYIKVRIWENRPNNHCD